MPEKHLSCPPRGLLCQLIPRPLWRCLSFVRHRIVRPLLRKIIPPDEPMFSIFNYLDRKPEDRPRRDLRHVLFRGPLFWLLTLFFRLTGIRILNVFAARVGHLALEVDCFIKEGILAGRLPCRGLILAPPSANVANKSLLEYWAKYVHVLRSPLLCRLLKKLTNYRLAVHSVHDYVIAMNRTSRSPAIQAQWGNRPPLVQLTQEHLTRGSASLLALGVPLGKPFVAVHCREPGYAPLESLNNLRDVDVHNYLPAIEALVERGYWVIRLGDPTMKPLPSMPGVIDYAHHPMRSDWFDLYLCANAAFILGSASGPCQMATICGVPCATANQVPLAVAYSHGPRDISIPKLFWARRLGRYLTFEELMNGPLGSARFTPQFEEAGVEVIENSPEDIRELALEMEDYVSGRVAYTPDDEDRQERLRRLFRPGHYCYGSTARIGRDFLRRYDDTLFEQQRELAVA